MLHIFTPSSDASIRCLTNLWLYFWIMFRDMDNMWVLTWPGVFIIIVGGVREKSNFLWMGIRTILRFVVQERKTISAVPMILIQKRKMRQVWKNPAIRNSTRLIQDLLRCYAVMDIIMFHSVLECTDGILRIPSVLKKT